MNEQFDFPRELRCDAVMLEKSHPYTADMLNRAAVEIEQLRDEARRRRAAAAFWKGTARRFAQARRAAFCLLPTSNQTREGES